MPRICPRCQLANPDTATHCDCGVDLSASPAELLQSDTVAQSMRWMTAFGGILALMLVASILYYFKFQPRFENTPMIKTLWVCALLGIPYVLGGLFFGGLVGVAMWIYDYSTPAPGSQHIVRTIFIVTVVVTTVTLTHSLTQPLQLSTTKSKLTLEDLELKDLSLLDKYSSSEKVRMNEIAFLVANDPDYMTPEVHAEFWAILTKQGTIPTDELNNVWTSLRKSVIELGVDYQRYFWEDALFALRKERAHKSVQREQLEKKMLKMNFIPEWRVQQNDKLIEQIAARTPVRVRGEQVIFTADKINGALGNIDAVAQRVDRLLTPPHVEKRG